MDQDGYKNIVSHFFSFVVAAFNRF